MQGRMEAVSNGDPLLVEAAGPSTTAERMIVLKPFVTSAFKQRVKLKATGDDPWSTPEYVLSQAMTTHGRNIKELSDVSEYNRRMQTGISLVRLQAEDYIGQRVDSMLDYPSDDEDDGAVQTAHHSAASSPVSSCQGTPVGGNTPRLSILRRIRVGIDPTAAAQALRKLSADGHISCADRRRPAAARKSYRYSADGGGGGLTIDPLLAAGNLRSTPRAASGTVVEVAGGSAAGIALAPARGQASAAAVIRWARASASKRLPRVDAQPPVTKPSDSRRVQGMINQLRKLVRSNSTEGAHGDTEAGGRGGSGAGFSTSQLFELHFARGLSRTQTTSGGGAGGSSISRVGPVNPLLTDTFVQGVVTSVTETIEVGTGQLPLARHSSPGVAGNSPRAGGGGDHHGNGARSRLLQSFRSKRPSLDGVAGRESVAPTSGAVVMATASGNGNTPATNLSPAVRMVAERWMYGRRIVNRCSGNGNGRTEGSCQSGPMLPTPPPPRCLDSPGPGALQRSDSPTPEPGLRSSKLATGRTNPNTGSGIPRTLDFAVAVAVKATTSHSETVEATATTSPSSTATATTALASDVSPHDAPSIRSHSQGVVPHSPRSRPDSPGYRVRTSAPMVRLFRDVTGTLPTIRTGEPVRPNSLVTSPDQEQHVVHSILAVVGTSPRSAHKQLRRCSSGNLEALMLQSTSSRSAKARLPKLDASCNIVRSSDDGGASWRQPSSRLNGTTVEGTATAPHSPLPRWPAAAEGGTGGGDGNDGVNGSNRPYLTELGAGDEAAAPCSQSRPRVKLPTDGGNSVTAASAGLALRMRLLLSGVTN